MKSSWIRREESAWSHTSDSTPAELQATWDGRMVLAWVLFWKFPFTT